MKNKKAGGNKKKGEREKLAGDGLKTTGKYSKKRGK
jgi:hypothetical protein